MIFMVLFHLLKTSVVQMIKVSELKSEQVRLKMELQKTEEEITSLRENQKSENDLDYVEKVAREELGMIKSDEMIVKDKKDQKQYSEKFSESPKLSVQESR